MEEWGAHAVTIDWVHNFLKHSDLATTSSADTVAASRTSKIDIATFVPQGFNFAENNYLWCGFTSLSTENREKKKEEMVIKKSAGSAKNSSTGEGWITAAGAQKIADPFR